MTYKADIFRPIPSFDEQRKYKQEVSYISHPLNEHDPRFNEPLVAISDLGLLGTAYYSNPNHATGEPVPGVSPNLYLREAVASKLLAVDEYLNADPRVAEALGGNVRINGSDGLRSVALQNYLRETAFPDMVRKNHPEWDEETVIKEAHRKIAPGSPASPHASGGAVDVDIVYNTDGYPKVFNAQGKDIASDAVYPDYMEKLASGTIEIPETLKGLSKNQLTRALMARRVLYNVMADPEIGGLPMRANPVEIWHYDHGTRLWAQMETLESGLLVPAHYGHVTEPEHNEA